MTYPPCVLTHNPLAFKLAFHKEQIYKCLFGNVKCDATISKIELNFLVGYSIDPSAGIFFMCKKVRQN